MPVELKISPMNRLASQSTCVFSNSRGRASHCLIVLACLFVGWPGQLTPPSLLLVLPIELAEEKEAESEQSEQDLFRRSRRSIRLELQLAPLPTADIPIGHISVADRDHLHHHHISTSRRVELIGAGNRLRC